MKSSLLISSLCMPHLPIRLQQSSESWVRPRGNTCRTHPDLSFLGTGKGTCGAEHLGKAGATYESAARFAGRRGGDQEVEQGFKEPVDRQGFCNSGALERMTPIHTYPDTMASDYLGATVVLAIALPRSCPTIAATAGQFSALGQ
jgi:hypothetical protein